MMRDALSIPSIADSASPSEGDVACGAPAPCPLPSCKARRLYQLQSDEPVISGLPAQERPANDHGSATMPSAPQALRSEAALLKG